MADLDQRERSELAHTEAAKARVEQRAGERAARVDLLEKSGGIAKADDPARVAARLDRLSRFWSRAPRPTAASEVPLRETEEMLSGALERSAWDAPTEAASLKAAGKILERVIGTADFVGINYLETGVIASRAVGRVNIGSPSGRVKGYGTGSLVAPGVLLTNHHVLEDAETARASTIEFDFEDGPDGQARQSHRFPFAPDALFFADEALDFALVAVEGDVSAYGFNPLIEAEGKAIIGEPVTIIQHPKGERKQIALRENRIVDTVDQFLHYETDTEPGSSGSLVFNDQWEAVALHHAGVPNPQGKNQGDIINEGIRVSQIVGKLREAPLDGAAGKLRDQVVQPATDRPAIIGVGGGGGVEAISINPDYSDRKGYDPNFLGGGKKSVPLPELSGALAAKAATMSNGASNGLPHVLPYHHFSVVINKDRKLAFFTAVNIDGALSRRLKREQDRWILDSRLPEDVQTGKDVYANNDLDQGHLVRRLDPAWGETDAEAKPANDDTFHYTNCAPQHADFNRNKTVWAGLEDHILEHAENEDFKVNVFSGPVFGDNDPDYRGVKLPEQFWKVVTMTKPPGTLSATAYLLSQEKLVEDMKEEFAFGEYRTYQVPVSKIEELTGLSFGSLADHDPLASHEAALAEPRELAREVEAVL